MTSLSDVFKAYDIRGVVPDQLNAEQFRAIGVAVARFTGAPTLLVARDMRASGVELSRAFADGARSEGVTVVDLGLASTDMLYFAAGSLDAPGAMFTASHNPAQYNGLKLCLAGARPIGRDTGLGEIQATAEALLASGVPAGRRPSTRPAGTARASARCSRPTPPTSASFVDSRALRPLKVVADTANGMGGLVAPQVFEGLPFECRDPLPRARRELPQPPGRPHPAREPGRPKGGGARAGADVGLAFDGDADRVFLVDEKAEPVSGSLTTALVASSMLDKHPGATILYNCICSRVVPEVIAEKGGIGVRTKVGHSFIKQVMAETGRGLRRRALRATTTSGTTTGPTRASSPPWSCSSC